MPKQSDTFAARLKRLREAAGLTVYALAKLSGVSEGHIGRMERGERKPSLETARQLARALGNGLALWD